MYVSFKLRLVGIAIGDSGGNASCLRVLASLQWPRMLLQERERLGSGVR